MSFIVVFLCSVHLAKTAVLLPAEIHWTVSYNATFSINFVLKKMEDSSENMVEVGANGGGDGGKTKLSATYMGSDYQSNFMVDLENGKFVFVGTFWLDRRPHSIWPEGQKHLSSYEEHKEDDWVVMVNGQAHRITKYSRMLMGLSDDEVDPPPNKESEEEKNKKHKKYVFQGKEDLTVEVFLVIEQSTYKRFLKLYKHEHEAIRHIKYYYSHIMNGVNDRLQRIEHDWFSLRSVTTALYIAKTEVDSEFTKMRADGIMNTHQTLWNMIDWVKKVKVTMDLPSFDVTVMVNDHKTPKLYGLAYLGCICLETSVAITRTADSFASIEIISHELGHVLGAKHDSDNNTCKVESQFIMAPSTFYGNTKFHNEGNFSWCSVHQFALQIRRINIDDYNCLLNPPPSSPTHPLDKATNDGVMMGQFFDMDSQCILFLGESSYFCRSQNMGDDLCQHLFCYTPEFKTCIDYWFRRSMDGTGCGDRKWCFRGACVADEGAPEMRKNECYWGDTKKQMGNDEDGQFYCHDIGNGRRDLCMSKDIFRMCCETCERLRDRRNYKKGCGYGDTKKQIHFRENEKFYCDDIGNGRKHLCLIEDIVQKCCETCERLKDGSRSDCPYGDKNPDECRHGYCFNNEYAKRCCETCSRTTPDGCQIYEPSFCAHKAAVYCYDEKVREQCCQKCLRLKNEDRPDCLYGDRNAQCEFLLNRDSDYCDDDFSQNECCGSC